MPSKGSSTSPERKSRKAKAGLADFRLDGKPRRAHELLDHFARGHDAGQMPGPQPHIHHRIVQRHEIGEANDVVVMAMREEDVDLVNCLPGTIASPACRTPEPASKINLCLPHWTSIHAVLPPYRLNSGPDTETLPRVPQNFTRNTSSFITALYTQFPVFQGIVTKLHS